MPKVILDANVILSGVLYGGTPALLLQGMQDKKFIVCLSQKLYFEVIDKLVDKFDVSKDILDEVNHLLAHAEIYTLTRTVRFSKDPKDAYLFALAEESDAEYLITGDKKHLLPLKTWKNTKIISPAQAREVLL